MRAYSKTGPAASVAPCGCVGGAQYVDRVGHAADVGIVISTIPFWGPNLDPGMKMKLDWIGTILAHYVAGAIVLVGGVLQLGALMSRRSEPLPG